MTTKQVIVIRKDLNMRKGKMIAQGSHASMAFLTKNLLFKRNTVSTEVQELYFDEIKHWIENSFTKVCLYVNSEDELKEVHENAISKGLISHLIKDNGKTEFKNIPTYTCCAIGPHKVERFENVTTHLPLY